MKKLHLLLFGLLVSFGSLAQLKEVGTFDGENGVKYTLFLRVDFPQVEVKQIENVRVDAGGYFLRLNPLSDIWLKSKDLTVSDDNKLGIQLSTHSITYSEQSVNAGQFALSEYTIAKPDGTILVHVKQNSGAKSVQLGGEYGNNHPSKRYLPDQLEDNIVYLAMEDYVITMKNTGPVGISFLVHSPDRADDEVEYLHNEWIEPNQTGSYYLSADIYRNLLPWKRAKKINNNDYRVF